MNEVSRRAAMWPYDAGRATGLSEVELFRGTGIDLSLMKRAKRVDWEVYVTMLDNIFPHLGKEGMREMGREYAIKDEFRSIRWTAGLFASPRALYHFLARWAGPANNSNMQFTMEDEVGGDSIYHTVTIEEGYRDAPPFFYGATGALEVMPCMIGLPSTRVELLELRERFAAYRIHLPRSRTVGSRLGRGLRGLKAVVALPGVLIGQSREIKDQSSALTRQHQDFRSLVDGLSACVFILDGDEMLYGNEALRLGLDLERTGDPGTVALAKLVTPGSRATWTELMENGKQSGGEVVFESAQGRTVILEISAPQKVAFGARQGFLFTGRDVTAERALDRRLQEVANLERQKLAMTLHDGLGQQLVGLALKAANLRDESGDREETRRSAGEIAELAYESIALARELAQGLAASDDLPGNLNRALQSEVTKAMELLGIDGSLHLPGDSQLTMSPVALAELTCAVREAISNGFRHGACRRVSVTMQVGEGSWDLAVENDGRAVSPGALQSGQGVGVTSMRYRLRELGGTVDWRALAAGTRVELRIPLGLIRAEPLLAPAHRHAGAMERPTGVLRVLVADDHRLVLEGLVGQINGAEGFEVCAHTTRRDEIVPLARREEPDVVLTDLLMNGSDNFSLIRELKQGVPSRIVVLSMGSADLYEQRVLEAGADAYVTKSAAREELLEALRGDR